jgi:predicted ATPase
MSEMKITELHVEGFRSLRDALWRPGDLNVVIGPNASGKSNLLKALEMLSASAWEEMGDFVRREAGRRGWRSAPVRSWSTGWGSAP